MESWSREFSEMMQAIVDGVEQFVTSVAKDVEEVMNAFVDASEEVVEQVQGSLAPDLEQRINEFIDPILEACLGFEGAVEETVQPVMRTVEPILNDHPTCVGCRNYHGQSYNGQMLVCGMHPFGWDGEKCPDWESTWAQGKGRDDSMGE